MATTHVPSRFSRSLDSSDSKTIVTWLIKKYTENNNICQYNNAADHKHNTDSLYLLVIDFDAIYIINTNKGHSVLTAERIRGCKVRLFNNNKEMNLIVEILENKLLKQLKGGGNRIRVTTTAEGQQEQLINMYREINHFVFQPYFEQDRQLIMKSIVYWQHPVVTQFSYSKLSMYEQQIIVHFTREVQVKGYDHPASIFQHNPRCLMLESNKMALCTIDNFCNSLKPIIELEYENIVDLYLNNVNNNCTNNILANDFDIDLPISLSFINGFEFIIYVLKSKINMTISYIKGQIARGILFKHKFENNMLKYDRTKERHSRTFMRMDGGSDNYNDIDEDENHKSIDSASIARIVEINSNNNQSMFQDERKRYNLNSNRTDLLIERNERPLHPKYLLKEEQLKLFVNTVIDAESINATSNKRKDASTKRVNNALDKYRYKPAIFEVDAKNGKIAASKEHREKLKKQSEELGLKKIKKLKANKETINKVEKTAKKQVGNKSIKSSQIINAVPVKTAEEEFEGKSINVQNEIANINKKVQFTDAIVYNYSIDNNVAYTVSNNAQSEKIQEGESDMNAKNVGSSAQISIAEEKKIDMEGNRYKSGGENEMIKTFRKNKKIMPTHRETPLMLRRSSLLNDVVGTLPFETESSGNDEKAIAKIEVQNEAIIPNKTIDVPGKYGKKVSAAKKNFRNLLISTTTQEQHIDKDSSPPIEKKKRKKKRMKKKQNVYDDNINVNNALPSPSTGGYRKHFSNALSKLASFSRRKNNK
jgi:hypothetical protein